MKKNITAVCSSLLIAAAFAPSSIAHHSFAAEFDNDKPVKFTGVVTKVEWRNPHAYFFVDVEDAKGKTSNWAMEVGSPNALARRGWKKDTLKIGDVVNIGGFQARDGSLKGNATSVVLAATGKRLFSASSYGGSESSQ
jgi:hypothetical protein